MNIENKIHRYVDHAEIPIFAITSADDFEHALPGWQPRELMPRANSILLFGQPFIEYPLTTDEKTHLADITWWTENIPIKEQIGEWRGWTIHILDIFGFNAANFGAFQLTTEPTFSFRLVMERAGLGTYARFGACIHPEYGCYFRTGVVLTDAELTPTPVPNLTGFNPCEDCSLCADICPVRAIDKTKPPSIGYNREMCMRFIMKISERYERESDTDPNGGVRVCTRCFGICPYSKALHSG